MPLPTLRATSDLGIRHPPECRAGKVDLSSRDSKAARRADPLRRDDPERFGSDLANARKVPTGALHERTHESHQNGESMIRFAKGADDTPSGAE
jgi:hypothetical protein